MGVGAIKMHLSYAKIQASPKPCLGEAVIKLINAYLDTH